MNIIKQSIHLIVEPLTYIINLSIVNGVVPNEMKLARLSQFLSAMIKHN